MMRQARKERRWKAGTRVRIVAPGYPFHGNLGTVEFDVHDPGAAVFVRNDNGKRAALATSEAARLRDQTRRTLPTKGLMS
jgi:hypothetical protein